MTSGTPNFSGGTATLLLDGRVLSVSGNNSETFDPETGIWTMTSGAPNFGGGTATLLLDGRVLVVSGTNSETFDPEAGIWTVTPGAPNDGGKPRRYSPMAVCSSWIWIIPTNTRLRFSIPEPGHGPLPPNQPQRNRT